MSWENTTTVLCQGIQVSSYLKQNPLAGSYTILVCTSGRFVVIVIIVVRVGIFLDQINRFFSFWIV